MKKKILASFLAFVLVLTSVFVVKPQVAEKANASDAGAEITPNTPDKDMLNIKIQPKRHAGSDATSAADDTMDLRVISSVNGLGYTNVGFEVYFTSDDDAKPEDCDPIIFQTATVLERINAVKTGVTYKYSPKVVDTSSEYFVTGTIMGVAYNNWDNDFYVRAFCTEMETGKVTYGAGRYFNVNEMLENDSINITLPTATAPSADATTNAVTDTVTIGANATATTATLKYYDAENDYAYLNVKVPAGATVDGTTNKTSLKSASKVTVGSAPTVYRNLESTYAKQGKDDSWHTVYDALDSSETKFVIATSADLYGLQNKTTSYNFASDQVYVVSDISVIEGKATDWITTAPATTNWWTPINGFAGKFYGESHTISGLYGKSNTEMGLFTSTANTTVIQDLKVTNSYFETSVYGLGAICGAGRGIFKNIYADAILVGTGADASGNVGGILGAAKEGTVTIENCWSNCTIQSDGKRVGGIIGNAIAASATVSIKHCLNTGTVTLKHTAGNLYRFYGGLVGSTGAAKDVDGVSTFIMDDCLNVGTVSASGVTNNRQGAILGEIGGTADITNTYALNTSTNNSLLVGGVVYESDTVKFKTASELAGDKAKTNTTLDWNYWSPVYGGAPVLTTFADDLDVLCIDTTWFDTSKNSGTITTRSQLYGFTSLATSEIFNSNSKVYLGADITVNEGAASEWKKTAPKYDWIPINAFAGTFDGNGHIISGLYGKSNTEMGLFTSTANTTLIENLKVTNSYFETSVYGLGAICGAGRGTFKNIYADAILVGTGADASGNVGGILGATKAGTVTIENCWSNCTIQADGKKVGGILGNGNAADVTVSIKHCLNTGTVTLKHTAGNLYRFYGGLVGSTGAAKDVDGVSTFIMDDCLNLGTVSASGVTNNRQGAILGEIGGTADITNTYALNTSTNNSLLVGGVVYTSDTVKFKTANELAGDNAKNSTALDFVNYWTTVDGSTPVLQSIIREAYLCDADKFAPSWNYNFPEEMMSYENKIAALNAVGEDARMISVFHKGGDTQNYPENSLEALISAIQMGADVVEVDLCKTADGHIVLMHDKTLSNYTDFDVKNGVNGLPTDDDITKWTLEQVRQLRLLSSDGKSGYAIPTLEEVLTVSNGRVKLVLDKIFDNSTAVLDWETDIYPIIEKTGAWDTWILPYQYDVNTQLAIADKLKEGAGADSLNIHAFIGFSAAAYSSVTTNATTLKENGITPIAYWYCALVTDTELTAAATALNTLKSSIRIMGQNHHSAGGTETSDMWDKFLASGVNMVLTDKGFDLQQYIAEKFFTTNE